MIVVIDNYDSFVHNLARYVRVLGYSTHIIRNDAMRANEIHHNIPKMTGIILSPGPCTPLEAGICLDTVRYYADKLPILGICLGHQVIAHAFGGQVIRSPHPQHGKPSLIYHDGTSLFKGLPTSFQAGRYHSLSVDKHLPPKLVLTAKTEDGEVMGIAHTQFPTYGLQFHPESVLTEYGLELLRNFLILTSKKLLRAKHCVI